jgi:metal-sulfur cluster biosynthetic enzyme
MGEVQGDSQDEALADGVMMALRRVIDPELGYNIVDLGLVYRVEIEDAAVHVVMTTTTRGCPATDYLRGGADSAASSVPGVASVTIELTYDPPWTPAMMSPAAKDHLGIGDGGW